MSKKPFYITTAIAYATQKPHVGNSYEIILTDAIARFKRLMGFDVFFCTGTDEHGQKIEKLAASLGISEKQHVDDVVCQIKEICDKLNVTYDFFIRTTDEFHVKTVQKIFKKLYNQGDIYKGQYTGMYCTPCESFFTETQLVDGKCPDCGRDVQATKEDAYFLKLSKYQQRLEQFIEENPNFIFPESRKKEMVNNFIKPGLQDLCVSRSSVKWGIPVDFDPKSVVYVWIDALSNYISALGYDAEGNNHGELYTKFWPCDVHIIGKDVLRFHTIYWPVMLMALDIPLPKSVFGHPWTLFGNDKMSKSKGNVIYADDLIKLIGVDAVRYYMLSEMPYAQDGMITYESIFDKYNSDLANTLGNLVSRTVAMVNKYFLGALNDNSCSQPVDGELKSCALKSAADVVAFTDNYRLSDAMDAIMTLCRRSNKYIDETEPWVLAKNEQDASRLSTVLYNLVESIRFISVLLQPFLPQTAENIFKRINVSGLETNWDSLQIFGVIKTGKSVSNDASPLFVRLDVAKMLEDAAEIMNLQKTDNNPVSENIDSTSLDKATAIPELDQIVLAHEIAFEDFQKTELRVALVKSCEVVKKSDKLLCLQLDDGMGGRQVVSGIAQWYKPEDLVGKKVIIVANLKPVKLRGVLSNGMILASDMPDGSANVIFVDPTSPIGSKIR